MDEDKSKAVKKPLPAERLNAAGKPWGTAQWRIHSRPKDVEHMSEHIRVARLRRGRVIVQKGVLKSSG